MTSYIALLRGINVGGHRKVPMAELRQVCEGLGYEDVSTYVQSGNVVFKAKPSAAKVKAALQKGIADRFGFDVDVVIRNKAELAKVAARDDLFPAWDRDETHLVVFFLAARPDPARIAALTSETTAPEEVVVDGLEAYVHYPNGQGRSKLNLNLGVRATARNWRTVRTLLEMAEAMD